MKEKIKIRNHEITLEEYQVDTLLDILREFMKANIIKNSEELIKKLELIEKKNNSELYSYIEKLKIMDPKKYNELFNIGDK
ncbi:hypothetical protein [Spiroplasma citri]|uniref:hypothetical protein n=1 Tax=Spiroplasma citri TaxID=2133 RepID=UPI0013A08F0C|nr:hypothetical protein [Spiroplasma citri]QIA67082.1 hypothetical protein GMI18_05160 [Spiroplasma citri]QIA67249.1 hypothetical protein GMI18_06155 [Spiroplasma citri]QIA67336.1 hypothetical protein GMI18_06630 [Spiroplasma citri]QIA73208.1 hypothetical protein GL982_06050 [Spiroplasma citri]QIA73380.1 hypothetical protein GL982_07075 [Spiroplasma citri]